MQADFSNLFLVEDLEDRSRTRPLSTGDLNALCTVADWIRTFVAAPNDNLGRDGPVCPFVPRGLECKTVWLAPERVKGLELAEITALLDGYKEVLLSARRQDEDSTSYQALVVVFPDLSADRAMELGNAIEMRNLRKRHYDQEGIVSGDFHMKNEGSAIRNRSFQPFKSPVPFVLMRNAVVSDWMFFLDSEDWLDSWSSRFGESALRALAAELRRTNWRQLESRCS